MGEQQGRLVVVSGPSGVGKGTLLQKLCDRHGSHLRVSISATTRSPRPHEVHGREYFFYSRTDFEKQLALGEFLEWAEYAGNLYGTPRPAVMDWISQGELVLLEIELQGARQVAQSYPAAYRIFIAPPSLAVLEDRLRQRFTESESVIAQRVAIAREELAAAAEFDCTIINDDLEEALGELELAVFGGGAIP
ncbi:MAG: guanylate kinase [Oscillatoriales cyanobacterium SM2_2_1]|nr:guanylate kinase [Oscillatoriales cyanobacterium SM2_2_1]